MQLSKDTLVKLKNFATIQPNLVYKGDGVLKTLAEANDILGVSTIEDIPVEFGIYDLNEFLATLDLVENPDIEFSSEKAIITSGNVKATYIFAKPEILTAPTKDIQMPSIDAEVVITQAELEQLARAGSVIGYDILCIVNDADGLRYSVKSSSAGTGSAFDIQKPDWDETDTPFSFEFKLENIKTMPGDYTVALSSKFISQWTGTEASYWIAIENTSTFG